MIMISLRFQVWLVFVFSVIGFTQQRVQLIALKMLTKKNSKAHMNGALFFNDPWLSWHRFEEVCFRDVIPRKYIYSILQYFAALHSLVYVYWYILVCQVQFDEGVFVTDHTALIWMPTFSPINS